MAIYTVAQVVAYLRDSLEQDPFLADLWVSGEVSNLSRSSAGHLYFTLKDGEGQMRCVMFRAAGRGGEDINNGDSAIVHGRVSIYPARGELQIYVDLVQPEGTGVFQLEFERLKAQLEEEGLFDPSRKRLLPAFPKIIGVVTSPTGAVFQDICNVLRRRYPLAEVVLSPTLVQGDRAAPSIIEAIHDLNSLGDVDVIIVARGGGSIEDLWPFNEEAVARAIYASRAPVISGVGHETDVTIADLVADVRAPTPSAAAEIAVPDAAQLSWQVAMWQQGAFAIAMQTLAQQRQRVDSLVQSLINRRPQVHILQQSVDDLTSALARGLAASAGLASERFRGTQQRLLSLNPVAILQRGYAFVRRDADGAPVTRVGQTHPDDALDVTVSDGAFKVRVV